MTTIKINGRDVAVRKLRFGEIIAKGDIWHDGMRVEKVFIGEYHDDGVSTVYRPIRRKREGKAKDVKAVKAWGILWLPTEVPLPRSYELKRVAAKFIEDYCEGGTAKVIPVLITPLLAVKREGKK